MKIVFVLCAVTFLFELSCKERLDSSLTEKKESSGSVLIPKNKNVAKACPLTYQNVYSGGGNSASAKCTVEANDSFFICPKGQCFHVYPVDAAPGTPVDLALGPDVLKQLAEKHPPSTDGLSSQLLDMAKVLHEYVKTSADDNTYKQMYANISAALYGGVLAFSPAASWAGDMYGALSGKDLQSGKDLSVEERGRAILGAASLGLAGTALSMIDAVKGFEGAIKIVKLDPGANLQDALSYAYGIAGAGEALAKDWNGNHKLVNAANDASRRFRPDSTVLTIEVMRTEIWYVVSQNEKSFSGDSIAPRKELLSKDSAAPRAYRIQCADCWVGEVRIKAGTKILKGFDVESEAQAVFYLQENAQNLRVIKPSLVE